MRAGSLLDDNQWHDIEIVRHGREVNFTVDRLSITNMTNGDFFQLDLDRQVCGSILMFEMYFAVTLMTWCHGYDFMGPRSN